MQSRPLIEVVFLKEENMVKAGVKNGRETGRVWKQKTLPFEADTHWQNDLKRGNRNAAAWYGKRSGFVEKRVFTKDGRHEVSGLFD